jgi:hypothetical protein
MAGITVILVFYLIFCASIKVKFKLYDCVCCQISCGVLSPVQIIASGFRFAISFKNNSNVYNGKSHAPREPQNPDLAVLLASGVELARQHTGSVQLTGNPSP